MFNAEIVLPWNTLFMLLISFSVSSVMAVTIILTERDAGRTIEIHNGDHLQVALEANPSTGYVWEPESLAREYYSWSGRQGVYP